MHTVDRLNVPAPARHGAAPGDGPPTRPGRSSQATEWAYERLRAAILDGTYPPATRLGEIELAAALGISRTPVRDALRRLSYEGLVEIVAHKGARVSSYTADDIEELFDLREMLEGYAAGRAASRITGEQLDRMRELCDVMDGCEALDDPVSYARLVRANEEFHRVVHVAAGSRRFLDLAATAAHVPVSLHTLRTYQPEDLRRSMSHHRELIAALRATDAEWARTVSFAHIRASRHALLRALTGRTAEPTPPGGA